MIQTSTKQNYQHKTLSSASLCTAAALVLGSYLFRSAVINWIVAALTLALVADLGFILLLEFTTRTHAGEDVRRVVARVWFNYIILPPSSQFHSRLIFYFSIPPFPSLLFSTCLPSIPQPPRLLWATTR